MKFIKALGLFLLLLVGIVLYILNTTGFFRKIENVSQFHIYAQINISGAEDITVSFQDSFALVSATDRGLLRGEEAHRNGLYYIGLRTKHVTPKYLFNGLEGRFFPHGISIYRIDAGQYKVAAINHVEGGHSIEVFHLMGDSLIHEQSLRHESLISPNDICWIDAERFYVSNDHQYTKGIMRLFEDYLGLACSDVVFYDGKDFHQAFDGISYANGITYHPKTKRLFVASARGFSVHVFQVSEAGALSPYDKIECGTGVDNMEWDEDGKLWIACHPSLMAFAAYAAGKKEIAPSEIIVLDYRDADDYQLESVYLEDGSSMSASSVAAPFGNKVFFGNVKDNHFLVLEKD